MNTRAIGRNIKHELVNKDMSQRELARAVGLTDTTMGRYINGQRQPSAYALLRIANVLGVTMEKLMHGIGDEND